MDNTKQFNCISLCTGYAGIELGLERVIPNLRTVCYVEVEAFACANLVAKIEEGKLAKAPVWTDIKTFDGRPFRNRVHIITGGYPCQPFSVAGQRKGTDDPRHLWPYIERIIEAVRPVWCFFENVSGHLTIGFPSVYRSLRNLGYSVEAGLFTAAEVGAPHKRERLFILANSEQRWGRGHNGEPAGQGRPLQTQGPGELADTESQRLATCKQGRNETTRPRLTYKNSNGMWPSRPGQPQYEWEEPRVIVGNRKTRQKSMADTESGGRSRPISKCDKGENTGQSKDERCNVIEPIASNSEGQTKPQLGREPYERASGVDAVANRVDRLRLLGNGVIPAQAELAFKVLYEKQIQTKKSTGKKY